MEATVLVLHVMFFLLAFLLIFVNFILPDLQDPLSRSPTVQRLGRISRQEGMGVCMLDDVFNFSTIGERYSSYSDSVRNEMKQNETGLPQT